MDKDYIRKILLSLRLQKGITQKQLAENLFVSDNVVSKWEKGVTLPDTDMFVKIADYYGVEVSHLLQKPIIDKTEVIEEDYKNYKKRRLPYSKFTILLDILYFISIGLLFYFIISNYNKLPDRIGVHFNHMGEIDGWGSKKMIFLFPSIALSVYLITSIFYFVKISWSINLIVPVFIESIVKFEKHKLFIYNLISIGLFFIKFAFLLLAALFSYNMIKQTSVNILFLLLSLSFLVLPIIVLVAIGFVKVKEFKRIEKYANNIKS